MKFTCDRDAFFKEIAFAQEIIASRNSISVLSNVLLAAEDNFLFIKATDMKVNFETNIPIELADGGSITVYCDKLFNILSNIPEGDIEFEVVENKITIKPLFKKIRFNLKSIVSEKFPAFPNTDNMEYFSYPSREFREMIQDTIFAVSDDETRYFMNGIFFESKNSCLNLVATDGRRLALYSGSEENSVPEFKSIIVPQKILNMVSKHAGEENPISIAIGEKHIFFKFLNYSISSVLIEGQFPSYQRVIPENQENSLVVNRQDFLSALKRISILVEQKSRRCFITMKDNEMVVSSEEGELGSAREEVACQYAGPEIVMAVNYRFFEDPLKVMNTENVEIAFTDPGRAVTLYPSPKSNFFHVVMPMQIE